MMCEFQFYYAHYKEKELKEAMPQRKNFVTMPAQHQDKQPGIESLMNPFPEFEDPNYKGSEKLKGKNVLITGEIAGLDELCLSLLQKRSEHRDCLFR